jgi:hypothetical protein
VEASVKAEDGFLARRERGGFTLDVFWGLFLDMFLAKTEF